MQTCSLRMWGARCWERIEFEWVWFYERECDGVSVWDDMRWCEILCEWMLCEWECELECECGYECECSARESTYPTKFVTLYFVKFFQFQQTLEYLVLRPTASLLVVNLTFPLHNSLLCLPSALFSKPYLSSFKSSADMVEESWGGEGGGGEGSLKCRCKAIASIKYNIAELFCTKDRKGAN